MDFYNRLNKLNDEELEMADFTREEIKSGLEDILKLYNINLTIQGNTLVSFIKEYLYQG